jgi:hypothetical protein
MMVLSVCAIMCLSWIFYIRGGLLHTSEEKLWEPLAVLGALAIEIVFLVLCFVLRNFWVFKAPKRPGRDGFFGF